jgi:hypothetical protein
VLFGHLYPAALPWPCRPPPPLRISFNPSIKLTQLLCLLVPYPHMHASPWISGGTNSLACRLQEASIIIFCPLLCQTRYSSIALAAPGKRLEKARGARIYIILRRHGDCSGEIILFAASVHWSCQLPVALLVVLKWTTYMTERAASLSTRDETTPFGKYIFNRPIKATLHRSQASHT